MRDIIHLSDMPTKVFNLEHQLHKKLIDVVKTWVRKDVEDAFVVIVDMSEQLTSLEIK